MQTIQNRKKQKQNKRPIKDNKVVVSGLETRHKGA